MGYFVGLDVSVKETSVCVVDDAGKVILEQKVPAYNRASASQSSSSRVNPRSYTRARCRRPWKLNGLRHEGDYFLASS